MPIKWYWPSASLGPQPCEWLIYIGNCVTGSEFDYIVVYR